MKSNIYKIVFFLIVSLQMYGQKEGKNALVANFGVGYNSDEMITNNFEIGYQRLVNKNLYVVGSFMKINGNRSMKDVLGQSPPLISQNSINDIYEFDSSELDKIPGHLSQTNNWSIGLKKYIQLGPNFFFAGTIAATYSLIDESKISGYIIQDNGQLDLTEMTNKYASYSSYGAKVGLEASYGILQNLDLNFTVKYLTHASLLHAGLGITFFLN